MTGKRTNRRIHSKPRVEEHEFADSVLQPLYADDHDEDRETQTQALNSQSIATQNTQTSTQNVIKKLVQPYIVRSTANKVNLFEIRLI